MDGVTVFFQRLEGLISIIRTKENTIRFIQISASSVSRTVENHRLRRIRNYFWLAYNLAPGTNTEIGIIFDSRLRR